MEGDYWFDKAMPDGSTLILSVLTRSDYEALNVRQMGLGNDFGYFIYRMKDQEVVDVLGKTDADHVFEVAELLGMWPPEEHG